MHGHGAMEWQVVRLRRDNRVLVAAVVGLAGLLLAGAAERPGVVRATAFQLTDEEGRVRAELAVKDGAVGLFLKDERGRDRLRATHDAGGTGLFLDDDAGTIRVGVAQFAHGGGGVALHGPGSKGAAVLYLKGEGSLRFFDGEGRVTNQVLATVPGSQ